MHINYIHPGIPVAAVRTTRNMLWTPQARKYADYKTGLIHGLQAGFFELIDYGPETGLKRERAKWLKGHQQTRYGLIIHVYEVKETSDGDNYLKTAADALQKAGLIVNDKKIKQWHCIVHEDKKEPRLELECWTL